MEVLFCPKCKKGIQSKDIECSHCGQPLENNKILCVTITPTLRKNRSIISGVVKILLALIFYAIGGALFKGHSGLWIVGFGIGAVFGVLGGNDIIGTRAGHCPHCQNIIEINAGQKKFRCPTCHNKIKQRKCSFESLPMLIDYSTLKKETSDSIMTLQMTSSHYSKTTDYSKYYQSWDDNYNKDLGYEWFKICVEGINYPNYNYFNIRLLNIRKKLALTQSEAAQLIGISASTLSSYENDRTTPTDNIYISIASAYDVPLSFLKYGYTDDFYQTFKLCKSFGEEEYVHSVYLSVKAASSLFPEMLTEEDKNICREIDTLLEMHLDLFNEQALKNEKIINQIKEEIINKLKEQELIQGKLWATFGENRELAHVAVQQLYESGIIEKEKHKNTYILRLSNVDKN